MPELKKVEIQNNGESLFAVIRTRNEKAMGSCQCGNPSYSTRKESHFVASDYGRGHTEISTTYVCESCGTEYGFWPRTQQTIYVCDIEDRYGNCLSFAEGKTLEEAVQAASRAFENKSSFLSWE